MEIKVTTNPNDTITIAEWDRFVMIRSVTIPNKHAQAIAAAMKVNSEAVHALCELLIEWCKREEAHAPHSCAVEREGGVPESTYGRTLKALATYGREE